MLVLSREESEAVYIGGGNSGIPLIKVVLVEMRGNKCRLGFDADPSVPIHRSEVYDRIERQNQRKQTERIEENGKTEV